MKRILLILNIFFMMMVMPVYAEETIITKVNDVLDQKYKLLTALGILENDDFGKNAEELVTRAEAAQVLLRLLKIPTNNNVSAPYFRDVMRGSNEEAAIYTAVDTGIMASVTDTYFYPAYPITGTDFAKAVSLSLGYSKIADEKRALAICTQNNLFKNTESTQQLSRKDFYILLYNTLSMPVVTTTIGDSPTMYFDKSIDLLDYLYNISIEEGIVTMAGGLDLDKKSKADYSTRIKINGNVFISDAALSTREYLGKNYICYYTELQGDNIVVFMEEKNNNTITFNNLDNLKYENLVYTSTENKKTKKYKLKEPYVILNNEMYFGALSSDVLLPVTGNITLLDNNADGYYDILFIYSYRDMLVKMANSELNAVYDYFGNSWEGDNKTEVNIFNNSGVKMDFAALTDKVVVSVMENSDEVFMYYSDKTLEGSINAERENNGTVLKIGTDEYKVSNYLEQLLNNEEIPKYQFEKTYVFYFNIFGEIVYFEEKTGFLSSSNYGVVTGVSSVKELDEQPIQLKIFSRLSGGFEVYELREKVKLNGVNNVKSENVYKALLRDGIDGELSDKPVAQIIEFAVNDENQITEIMQTGPADKLRGNLYMCQNSLDKDGYSRPYREILVSEDVNGRFLFNGKRVNQDGFTTAHTQSFQIPYRDGKIAGDREDLFALKAIPRATSFKYLAYKKDPNAVMLDFVAIAVDANAALNCGDTWNIYMVSEIKQVYRDDEVFYELTTETDKYYLGDEFDVTKLIVYDKAGFETGQTYALKPGDLVNIIADANNKVVAIEPIFDYENDCFIGTTDSVYNSRTGMYNLAKFYLYKFENGYTLLSEDRYEDYTDQSILYLTNKLANSFYFKNQDEPLRKARDSDFISMQDSTTDYIETIVDSRYNDPGTMYLFPVIK